MNYASSFVIQAYKAYLDRKRILRLGLSQTFKRGVYNYNIDALYYTDDSIVPVGERAGHTEGPWVSQKDSDINTYERYLEYLKSREKK